MFRRPQDTCGFSRGIHENGCLLYELQETGFKEIESSCWAYQLKPGTHIYEDHYLVQSFVDYMTGILSLAFLHVPALFLD